MPSADARCRLVPGAEGGGGDAPAGQAWQAGTSIGTRTSTSYGLSNWFKSLELFRTRRVQVEGDIARCVLCVQERLEWCSLCNQTFFTVLWY